MNKSQIVLGKLLVFITFIAILNGCKKEDELPLINQTVVHQKFKIEKVERAKAFYEKHFGNQLAKESINPTPNWDEASIGSPVNKDEAVIVPLEYGSSLYYSFINTTSKENIEDDSKLWMYETSPNVFTAEAVTIIQDPVFADKSLYMVTNLLTGVSKSYISTAGIIQTATTTKTAERIIDPMAGCKTLYWYQCTRNRTTGDIYDCDFLYTTSTCDDGGGGGSGGAGIGYNPNDEDGLEKTKIFEWLAWYLTDASNPNIPYHWEVFSYEKITGKKTKTSNGTFIWEIIQASHSTSEFRNNSANVNVVYRELAGVCNVLATDKASAELVASLVQNTGIYYSINRAKTITRNEVHF